MGVVECTQLRTEGWPGRGLVHLLKSCAKLEVENWWTSSFSSLYKRMCTDRYFLRYRKLTDEGNYPAWLGSLWLPSHEPPKG